VIALDAGTVNALSEHRRRQLGDRMERGSAWVDSGQVFTRENGKQLHPARVTAQFIKLAEQTRTVRRCAERVSRQMDHPLRRTA